VEFKGKKYKVVSMDDGIAAKPAVAIFQQVVELLWSGLRNLQLPASV